MTALLLILAVFVLLIVIACASAAGGQSSGSSGGETNAEGNAGFKIIRCPNCGAMLRVPVNATRWDCGWCGDCGNCR